MVEVILWSRHMPVLSAIHRKANQTFALVRKFCAALCPNHSNGTLLLLLYQQPFRHCFGFLSEFPISSQQTRRGDQKSAWYKWSTRPRSWMQSSPKQPSSLLPSLETRTPASPLARQRGLDVEKQPCMRCCRCIPTTDEGVKFPPVMETHHVHAVRTRDRDVLDCGCCEMRWHKLSLAGFGWRIWKSQVWLHEAPADFFACSVRKMFGTKRSDECHLDDAAEQKFFCRLAKTEGAIKCTSFYPKSYPALWTSGYWIS